MPIIFQPWRAALQPASFGGAGFHVEVGGQAGGRRAALHEYPKKDTPYAEDMGRRARRWPITGYVIGRDYLVGRDALIAACETGDAQTLVHPSLGEMQAICDNYAVTETRERGGIAMFEMQFIEKGASPDDASSDDTQSQAGTAANGANDAAAAAGNAGLAGQGGIGSDAAASAQALANVTPLTTPQPLLGSVPAAYPSAPGGIGSA